MAIWPAKKVPTPPVEVKQDDLNELLQALTAYGSPRVSYIKGGWYAAMEVNTGVKGVSTELASGFDEPSPLGAVQTLADLTVRMLERMA